MPRQRPHPHPSIFVLMLLALTPATGRAAAEPAPGARAAISTPRPHFFPVSAAGAELMREVWEAGGLRGNPQVRAVVERMMADEAAGLAEPPVEPAAIAQPFQIQALGNDAIANNRALSSCTCSGRPISQAEPSIAAWGPYALASWNDRRSLCAPAGSPSQSHAWSMDYGATFREGMLLRGPGPTDAFHGDPTVAVNRKTGDFYISGILRQGSTFVGVAAVRGHFSPDSFVIDTRRVIALAAGGDFLDKPWMAADSLTGNVYITWTNFPADLSTRIELQRLDADLNPLGPIQVVRNEPYGVYGVQGSFPTVGPDGVLYVPYSVLYGDTLSTLWNTPSHLEVVRSNDGGATFGPPHTIVSPYYHPLAIPPGSQRGFWPQLLAMDVDRTHGPHRGRAYVVWPEGRPLGGAVFGNTSVVEKENNGFFASATPFTPGQTLRATSNGVDKDIFKFTGTRGQIFFWMGDSAGNVSLRTRLLCAADTSTVANYHLFYTRATNSGGSGGASAIGLPYDGTYYLVVESPFANFGGYRFSTALVPGSPSDRARGTRDEFVSYSDDGATWSTPARLNDNDPWFDGSEPQVAVDGRGRVHTCWLDWRDDTQCGTSSSVYGASSGDGGVTWGANRRLSDASSFWGALASCSDNNQGDFMQMAADGDHVYAASPDSRLGDPDIFVDASSYASTASCPANQVIVAAYDNVLQFPLTNNGNFATPLAWALSDNRGWLTGASPGTSGSATLAANGGTITISGTFHPPVACSGDSTVVSFVTSDPYIPGMYDTCRTVLHCDAVVPTLLALVDDRVVGDRVTLIWHGADAAGALATIERRGAGEDWASRATISADHAGTFTFEEGGVPPGRYAYRIRVEGGALSTSGDVWVEVRALELALRGTRPNPAGGGPIMVSFTLPGSAPATLEVLDLAGRRLASRAVGGLGPGTHELRLSEAESFPGGVYLMRLRQGAKEVVSRAVVVR
jgi:hypothetical protein